MRRSIGRNRVFAGQGRALAALPTPFGSVAGGLPSRSADDKPTGSAFKGVLDWTRNATQRRCHFHTSSFLLKSAFACCPGAQLFAGRTHAVLPYGYLRTSLFRARRVFEASCSARRSSAPSKLCSSD